MVARACTSESPQKPTGPSPADQLLQIVCGEWADWPLPLDATTNKCQWAHDEAVGQLRHLVSKPDALQSAQTRQDILTNLQTLNVCLTEFEARVRTHRASPVALVEPLPKGPWLSRHFLDVCARILRALGSDKEACGAVGQVLGLCAGRELRQVALWPAEHAALVVAAAVDSALKGGDNLEQSVLAGLELFIHSVARAPAPGKLLGTATSRVLLPGFELVWRWSSLDVPRAAELSRLLKKVLEQVVFAQELRGAWASVSFAADRLAAVAQPEVSPEEFPACKSPAQLVSVLNAWLTGNSTEEERVARLVALNALPLVLASWLATAGGGPSEQFRRFEGVSAWLKDVAERSGESKELFVYAMAGLVRALAASGAYALLVDKGAAQESLEGIAAWTNGVSLCDRGACLVALAEVEFSVLQPAERLEALLGECVVAPRSMACPVKAAVMEPADVAAATCKQYGGARLLEVWLQAAVAVAHGDSPIWVATPLLVAWREAFGHAMAPVQRRMISALLAPSVVSGPLRGLLAAAIETVPDGSDTAEWPKSVSNDERGLWVARALGEPRLLDVSALEKALKRAKGAGWRHLAIELLLAKVVTGVADAQKAADALLRAVGIHADDPHILRACMQRLVALAELGETSAHSWAEVWARACASGNTEVAEAALETVRCPSVLECNALRGALPDAALQFSIDRAAVALASAAPASWWLPSSSEAAATAGAERLGDPDAPWAARLVLVRADRVYSPELLFALLRYPSEIVENDAAVRALASRWLKQCSSAQLATLLDSRETLEPVCLEAVALRVKDAESFRKIARRAAALVSGGVGECPLGRSQFEAAARAAAAVARAVEDLELVAQLSKALCSDRLDAANAQLTVELGLGDASAPNAALQAASRAGDSAAMSVILRCVPRERVAEVILAELDGKNAVALGAASADEARRGRLDAAEALQVLDRLLPLLRDSSETEAALRTGAAWAGIAQVRLEREQIAQLLELCATALSIPAKRDGAEAADALAGSILGLFERLLQFHRQRTIRGCAHVLVPLLCAFMHAFRSYGCPVASRPGFPALSAHAPLSRTRAREFARVLSALTARRDAPGGRSAPSDAPSAAETPYRASKSHLFAIQRHLPSLLLAFAHAACSRSAFPRSSSDGGAALYTILRAGLHPLLAALPVELASYCLAKLPSRTGAQALFKQLVDEWDGRQRYRGNA